MKFLGKKLLIRIGVFIVLLLIIVPIFKWLFPPAHRHCIKGATFTLLDYANYNNGRFLESEDGWADALLKLSEYNYHSLIREFTGVDDDGTIFRDALEGRTKNINEAQCSRIYIQGLTTKSNNSIAILFDKNSEPGGDHFRSPLREPVREVIFVGGSFQVIEDKDWPNFVINQRALLKTEGFSEELINEYYGLYGSK